MKANSKPDPANVAAQEQQKKDAARAPQQPRKDAPKPKPTESGKPVWDRPHSS